MALNKFSLNNIALNFAIARGSDLLPKWYKFDDGEVSECKMDDDEEMKNQCFGGEYLGEIFDHMLKRLNFIHFGCILV